MTRDFNKQPRDDERPPSRNSSSNRYGEERPPRPARPRLNREMVDRAWENGAPRVHADYHPRGNNGSAPRNNNWRGNQNTNYSSQGGPGANRPYSNRQDNPRDNAQPSGRPFNGNPGPRGRSYDANNRYNSEDQSFGNRRGYNDGPPRPGNRPGFNNNNRPQTAGQGSQYRPQGNSRPNPGSGPGPQGRPAFGKRPPVPGRGTPFQSRELDNNRVRRGADRNAPPPRTFERGNNRGYRPSFNGRNARDVERPYRAPNPREQSRPWVQQEMREAQRTREQEEQFEGDYEHFDSQEAPRQFGRPSGNSAPGPRRESTGQYNTQERHVTQLPDGRTLKGSRPAQRKNAEFWTDIAGDTEELVGKVHPLTTEEDTSELSANTELSPLEEGNQQEPSQDAGGAIKRPIRRSSRPVRGGKKGEVRKPRSSGPKPSQRGFKWPAP